MERERWSEMLQAVSEVARGWVESKLFVHSTALIVRV